MSQMKCSISMSSLESPSKYMRTPDGSKKAWNSIRPCNSLSSKKPRRAHEAKMRRCSWESGEDITPEELWKACLQSVQGLTDVNTNDREFMPVKDFLEDYSSIREWLNSVQVERRRFADSAKLSQLAETLRTKLHLRVEMIEKAKLLVRKFPKMKEEFHWRIKHMNSQWDSLEKILLCQNSVNNANYIAPIETALDECDIKWVREWLRKMENELQPLAFNVQWTSGKLQQELIRHKALQTEIEAKSPAVHSALRQNQNQGRTCTGTLGFDGIHPPRNKKRGDILEKRWIQLRLRVLEWVEHLSTIQKSEEHRNKGRKSFDNICTSQQRWESEEADENQEPLSKYPRLCDSPSILDLKNLEESYSSEINSIVDLANHQEKFNDSSDWAMGQSHESESVYQSGSPTSNPDLTFQFEDIGSGIGMKRKLNSPQSPTATTEAISPMNISTYYFKHSDTEPEPQPLHSSTPFLQKNHESQTNRVTINNHTSNGNGPVRVCQKSLDLDFSQAASMQGDERFKLKRLSQFTPSEGDEDSLEFGIDLFLQDMDAAEEAAYADLQNLNEIEELVQKAELLVKSGTNSGIRKSQSQQQQYCQADDVWEEEGGDTISQTFATGYSVRKCSQLNAIVPHGTIASSSSERLNLSMSTTGSKKLRKSSRCGNLSMNLMEGSALSSEGGRLPRVEGESDHAMETNTSLDKVVKKNARVRQWVRAHNHNGGVAGASVTAADNKNTSSCDASAESASESDSEISHSEQHLSSDDPTTLSASTAFLQPTVSETNTHPHYGHVISSLSLRKGASATNINQRSPAASTSGTGAGAAAGNPGIVWRSKKRSCFVKQRPKSFTDTFGSQCVSNFDPATTTFLPRKQRSYFVSDPALNCIGNRHSGNSLSSSSGGSPAEQSNTDTKKKIFKRKLLRHKKRSLDFLEDEADGLRSSLFCGEKLKSLDDHADLEKQSPIEVTKPLFFRLNSDHTSSVHTDEIVQSNDQDWDSYQEKYLSEPYSEEPYDQDRTLKLLAFGEDYDQVLQADSESSSMLSGFEPNVGKRRPLVLINRGEMPESDSDREEFNHLLNQSMSQLRFIDLIFRKLAGSNDFSLESPVEFAEMEATCEENINSLKLILSNIDKPDAYPFPIDVKAIEGVLEGWQVLKDKIIQAAKLQQIHEEMDILRKEFDGVNYNLEEVDPFDSRDLGTLYTKIEQIQGTLHNLAERKKRLQKLNEASLGSQLLLKESVAISDVKKQLQELYSLYEENFQLGSYLLGKMKYLQEAWELFESEKSEFEKTMNSGIVRPKLRKELSSAASTDSGHGTDFSHDSSISDSDMDFQERKQKLVALKKRASDLKSFLPPGSPVLDVVEMKINEAQRDFESMSNSGNFNPLDLKIIYPAKRSRITRRISSKSPKLATIVGGSQSPSPVSSPKHSSTPLNKESNRNWRVLRFSLTFHLALIGLFAFAWFLQPRCCEHSNTFCFSLVPHLTHEKIPHI